MGEMVLSAVIITRNEESNIAACIQSVLKDFSGLESEVLLVDSASVDRTLSVAGAFPIRIIRLSEGCLLSPSAGRYVGTLNTRGEFILFLDGDMRVIEGWTRAGLAVLADETLGAVAGRLYRVDPGEVPQLTNPDRLPAGSVMALGGAGIYRRRALRDSGSFNPFLKGEEERELGYRLTSRGYAIRRIETPMACHMEKSRTASEVGEKATHFYGVGQIVRAHPGSSLARHVLSVQWKEFAAAVLVAGPFAVAGVALIVGGGVMGGAVLVATLLTWMILSIVKGWERTAVFVRGRILTLWHFLRGLVAGVRRPEEYKVIADVVK
jgi:hypothetical protein